MISEVQHNSRQKEEQAKDISIMKKYIEALSLLPTY